jgi:hypothetical protein
MTRRLIVLAALVAALAVPAISFADEGGGTTTTPSATHDGSKLSAALDRASARLDKRFAAFSAKCLVANAPKRCAKVANRAVQRMDRAQVVLTKIESKINTKCGAASPPALCANAGTVTGKIDALRSKLQSDEAAIKAAFPNAGSGQSAASGQSSS